MINLMYPVEFRVGDKVLHNGKVVVVEKIYEYAEKLYRLSDGVTTVAKKLERRSYDTI